MSKRQVLLQRIRAGRRHGARDVGPGHGPGHQQSAATEIGEVVVTGSFIRGTPEDTALPVDVIGAGGAREAGQPQPRRADEVPDRSPTACWATPTSSTPAPRARRARRPINLRGLGPPRTLVLWNGRRMASTRPTGRAGIARPQRPAPPPPSAAIEVLKDGAAATYGSDAIAGVVNFITAQDVDGLEVGGHPTSTSTAPSGDWDGHGGLGQASWDNVNVTADRRVPAPLQAEGRRPRARPARLLHRAPKAGWPPATPHARVPAGCAARRPWSARPRHSRRAAACSATSGCTPLGGHPRSAARRPPASSTTRRTTTSRRRRTATRSTARPTGTSTRTTKFHLEGLLFRDRHARVAHLAVLPRAAGAHRDDQPGGRPRA